jgi:hypothetical protein
MDIDVIVTMPLKATEEFVVKQSIFWRLDKREVIRARVLGQSKS